MLRILKRIKYPLTICLCIVILIAVFYLKRKLNNNQYENIVIQSDYILELDKEKEGEDKDDDAKELCSVDIKGAIKNPGVYLLECSNNVNDVISIAGGLLENSDTSVINLAKKLVDEMVIIIYTKEEVKNSNIVDTVVKTIEKECICPNIQNDGCINEQITDNIGESNQGLININTASLEELLSLPGIGESKAEAIIKYRTENGNFNNISELLNVSGIGTKLYEDIKAYITT